MCWCLAKCWGWYGVLKPGTQLGTRGGAVFVDWVGAGIGLGRCLVLGSGPCASNRERLVTESVAGPGGGGAWYMAR